MCWMFEPRSKDYYYDDDKEGGNMPSTSGWHEFLLLPLIFPLMFLVAIFYVLILLFIILDDFYTTAKRVYENGELEFPGLVYMGIVLTLILFTMNSNHLFAFKDHPVITFCSSIFVLLFTIAPLTGLALRFFRQN